MAARFIDFFVSVLGLLVSLWLVSSTMKNIKDCTFKRDLYKMFLFLCVGFVVSVPFLVR